MGEEKVLEILKVIAHPSRVEILRRIKAHEAQGMVTCSCVLDGMDISQSTFSHHVSELSQCGLVTVKAQGRYGLLSIDQAVWEEFQGQLGKAVFG